MLRDGLTTNLNFTKYLQELSNEELDDLNIKLNSCGYPGSENVEELINLVELFIEDHNLSKTISKEHLWLELLNNGYVLGDRILLLSNPVLYGSDVEELQEYLSRLGFYSEPINSTFDNNVSRSVKLFQENRGLSVDGTVGLETAAEIKKLLRPTMNTSLNEAVKTFKGSSSNLSICFDIENRGDYKKQIGLYQKIKDFCNENNLNISFSSNADASSCMNEHKTIKRQESLQSKNGSAPLETQVDTNNINITKTPTGRMKLSPGYAKRIMEHSLGIRIPTRSQGTAAALSAVGGGSRGGPRTRGCARRRPPRPSSSAAWRC